MPDAVVTLIAVAVAAAILVAIVTHLALYAILSGHGIRVPFILTGVLWLPVVLYVRHRRVLQGTVPDLLAVAAVLSPIIGVCGTLWLSPYF